MDQASRTIALSVVMPTTAWSGTFEPCARRVLEILDSTEVPCEFIVALDGPAADPPEWLRRRGVTIVATGVRSGPAVARNLAVKSARGSSLFFVDADVLLAHGTLERAHATLDADPGLAGVFGTYDDTPTDPGVVSRFKNLLHHHTHSTHPGPVGTFWAGCGAIRRGIFDSVGGFLSSYGCPSVEDIELGMRATAAGHRIEIDPRLQCTHLKRWTLSSMVVTDIMHRAVPWSRLLLSAGSIPATLNIDWRGRASGLCATAAAVSLAASPFLPAALIAATALAAVAVVLNTPFFRLCARKGGIAFACACVPLHLLYLAYSTLTFAAVAFAMRPWLGMLTAALGAAAVAAVTLGVQGSWTQGTDGDLQARAAEYAGFREGVYPNRRLDPQPEGTRVPYSVYLPYAFPMFVPLFEPGGLAQARIVVASLSLAALAAIGIYGSRILSRYGPAWAAVGGLAAAGITINRSTFAQGQFAIICMGGIALQLVFLQRGKPLLAGACWALAMLKPHVGIAFAALFLFNRQWRGLVFGISILAALSYAALWWTGVPVAAAVKELMLRSSMRFISEPEGFSVGRIAEWTGWDHRVVQYGAVGVVLVALGGIAFALRRVRVADLLLPAAICAVLGRVLIYHRPYDQVMLWPLLVACIAVALRIRTAASVAVAGAVAYTLWAPLRVQLLTPFPYELQTAVWIAAAAYLAVHLVAPERMSRIPQ